MSDSTAARPATSMGDHFHLSPDVVGPKMRCLSGPGVGNAIEAQSSAGQSLSAHDTMMMQANLVGASNETRTTFPAIGQRNWKTVKIISDAYKF